MRASSRKAAFLALLLLCLVGASFGQTLGDIARQERLKHQNQDPQTAPRVITNDDLRAHGDDLQVTPNSPDPHPSRPTKTAAQWRAEISRQENKVASMQSQIDHLTATIRFASAACAYHCVEHNENQLKKEDQIQRMQDQLDEEKTRLDDLKEGARQDGFGNSVYEP